MFKLGGRENISLKANRRSVLLLAATLVFACAGLLRGAFAQETARSQSASLVILSASFADKQVAADEPIEFHLSRSLSKAEGSIAVIIGQSDLTGLFSVKERSLRYDSKTLPLPSGEPEVILYLVSPTNEWKELAKFTLRVGIKDLPEPSAKTQSIPKGKVNDKLAAAEPSEATPKAAPQQDAAPEKKPVEKASEPNPNGAPAQSNTPAQSDAVGGKQPSKTPGFDKLTLVPSITLSINSQPAQSNFPASNRPGRATFTTLNLQASFKGEMERASFTSQTQFDFVGSSFQQEALRFGQLGDVAPQVDLSSYLMQFKLGKVRYQFGHFSFGASRHLMNGFSSRGMTISVPLAGRGDFSLSAMNGTSIVGYSNFFGLDKGRHRLFSGTLGLELAPKRPGGVRVEVGALDGWLQPVNGFSQGSVNDAERSRGLGFRLLASDPAQRFKLDTGLARSRFTSPFDPLVSQGTNLKPFPSVARNARYLDASYEILRDAALTKDRRVNLAFGFRHELVDPLFRSLGASTQADKFSNDFSLSGAVGDINAQFTHSRFNDNLKDVPSILKSLTRANTFNVGAPLGSLFSNAQNPSPLLPRVSYTINRTRQFGAAIPVRGGFELDPGSIPDQVGTNQAVTADWQIQKWRLGYRFNHSLQDNQQLTRERDDLASLVNGITLGVSPGASLDLNFDLNADSANNKGAGTIDRTLRFAPSINWRLPKKTTLASTLSITLAGDEAETRRNGNVEFDVQWACQFGFERDRFRKGHGQFFIRYANRYAHTRNNSFGLSDIQKTQIVNIGLSFTLF